MKKKMERLGDELFRPLTPTEQTLIAGRIEGDTPVTTTPVTMFETYDPAPDWSRDGDNE
jgi:hypothetical protein